MDNINEVKKLIKLVAKFMGITGDVVADGRFDWGDALRVGQLMPVMKDLFDINYSLTAEEFTALTETNKDELVAYFNEEFKMDLKLGEVVVEGIFAGLMDFYMGIKLAIEVFERFKTKNFA